MTATVLLWPAGYLLLGTLTFRLLFGHFPLDGLMDCFRRRLLAVAVMVVLLAPAVAEAARCGVSR